MLLAARALKEGNDSITLSVNGAPRFGRLSQTRPPGAISSTARSPSPTPARRRCRRWLPQSPRQSIRSPPAAHGFTIDRTYYKLDGTEANVTEARQNERYVVVLKIYEQNKWPSRLLITDLLPRPASRSTIRSLVSSAQLSNFSWLAQTDAAHLEFRDDRFVAAFNPKPKATATATSRWPMSCAP
ncbi:alpha-2-macroglobulin family protein [Mesorhizobium atlanticum]